MDVDWITVAAQIVNFLVLVWLLKRFLYGPILKAMETREARIADSLDRAEREREAAASEADRLRQMQRDLESQRSVRLVEAQEEADTLRKSLQSNAREDVANQRAAWIKNLGDEKDAFFDDIRQRTAEAFSTMARIAFSDLANERLEDQIARRFEKALRSFDGSERKKLEVACRRANGKVSVRTSFDLSSARQSDLTAAIRETIADEADVSFQTSQDVICGVELRASGQVVRWSLDSFLDQVETDMSQAVAARIPETGDRLAR